MLRTLLTLSNLRTPHLFHRFDDLSRIGIRNGSMEGEPSRTLRGRSGWIVRAGLSLLEDSDQRRNFHWRAIAGVFSEESAASLVRPRCSTGAKRSTAVLRSCSAAAQSLFGQDEFRRRVVKSLTWPRWGPVTVRRRRGDRTRRRRGGVSRGTPAEGIGGCGRQAWSITSLLVVHVRSANGFVDPGTAYSLSADRCPNRRPTPPKSSK
jgi:hypothetical protein